MPVTCPDLPTATLMYRDHAEQLSDVMERTLKAILDGVPIHVCSKLHNDLIWAAALAKIQVEKCDKGV